MRVLVVTQKVDNNDSLLGFFCGWLNELAKKIDKIYVLALEVKNIDLAENIELYSLDKENANNRLSRFLKFNRILANLCLNKKIDVIFIHMCPIYAILAAPYAKLFKVPQVLWYAHREVNLRLRASHFLVDRILTPSKESFGIESKKMIITGHGIDIQKFQIPNSKFQIKNNRRKIILSVGRISPIKDYETLIQAADILINQKSLENLEFVIVGDTLQDTGEKYYLKLKRLVNDLRLDEYIRFVGPVSYQKIQNYYQDSDIFINTSPTGGIDKVVLEAMAQAFPVLTCNESFKDILGFDASILMFNQKDAPALARRIECLIGMDEDAKSILDQRLREIVSNNHNLDRLTDKFVSIFEEMLPR